MAQNIWDKLAYVVIEMTDRQTDTLETKHKNNFKNKRGTFLSATIITIIYHLAPCLLS